LWWEFWPGQAPALELGGSLGRMGLDHIDLLHMITGLISAGTRGPGGR
jgi:hypothetical protein